MTHVSPLSSIITRIEDEATGGKPISISTLQAIAGRNAAGPMLFFPAMIVVSPLSLIPTLPTLVAVTIIIVASQVLAGRRTIWLPRRIKDRCLPADKVEKALSFLKKAAAFIERFSKPRLEVLVNGFGMRLASVVCILVAITMPPMELVPGASTSAGVIISAFGLSITMRDGLLMLLGLFVAVALPLLGLWFFLWR